MRESTFIKNRPDWSYNEIADEVRIFCSLKTAVTPLKLPIALSIFNASIPALNS